MVMKFLIYLNKIIQNIIITKEKILKILYKARIYIAYYFKDVYALEDISTQNEFSYFAVDESDFIKIDGRILLVIGIIDTSKYKLRLEISFERNESILKQIIKAHIKPRNYIVSDGWPGYSWIGLPFSGYIHSVHNHGHGDFYSLLNRTSYIRNMVIS